jgi:hypothetical protein
MPDQGKLAYTLSKQAADLKSVRLPGANKPLEQLTISELVQLRASGGAAADSYQVNAVGSDVTISSSSALSELAQTAGESAVRNEIASSKVRSVITGGVAPHFDIKLPGH